MNKCFYNPNTSASTPKKPGSKATQTEQLNKQRTATAEQNTTNTAKAVIPISLLAENYS
jgi:hypothetical protein